MAKISGAAAYQQLKPIGNYIADSANKAADRAAANMRNQSNINSKEKDAQKDREEAEKVRKENARIEAEKKKNTDLDNAQSEFQAYQIDITDDSKNLKFSVDEVGANLSDTYEVQQEAIKSGDVDGARKAGDKMFNISNAHKTNLKATAEWNKFNEGVKNREGVASFVIQNSEGAVKAGDAGGITPKINKEDGNLYYEIPVQKDGVWKTQTITAAEIIKNTPALFDDFDFLGDIKTFNTNVSKDSYDGNYSWKPKNDRELDFHLDSVFSSDHSVFSAVGQQPELYKKLGWEEGNLSNLSHKVTAGERKIVKEHYKSKYKNAYSSKYTPSTPSDNNTGTGTWNVTTTEGVEAPENSGVGGMKGKGTGKTFLFPSKSKGNLLGIAGVGKNGETLNEIWVNNSGESFGLFMKPLTERNTSSGSVDDEGAGFDITSDDSGKTTKSLSVKKGDTEWRKMTSGELSKYKSQTGGASGGIDTSGY